MVDITGQENLPGEFLQQIILLVGAFGRRHHAKSLRAGFVGDLDQSRGDDTQNGFPVDVDPWTAVGDLSWLGFSF